MTSAGQVQTRRDRYREETKADLSRSAFDLAVKNGLSNVRIPHIAAAAGVSTRTFNNYFSSKEEAIVWPIAARVAALTAALKEQPAGTTPKASLIEAITSQYETTAEHDLMALITAEPALQAEYLKAANAVEQALADALVEQMGSAFERNAHVLAAVIIGAENAAVSQWTRQHAVSEKLVDAVRDALTYALAGLGATL